MKRPRRRQANVSLFPFLAVLLCTMGSLIVVLVLIAEKAKEHLYVAENPTQVETQESQEPSEEEATPLPTSTPKTKIAEIVPVPPKLPASEATKVPSTEPEEKPVVTKMPSTSKEKPEENLLLVPQFETASESLEESNGESLPSEIQLELADWRVDQLKQQRERSLEDLAEERLRLSVIEDHLHTLRQQLEEVTVSLEEFDRIEGSQKSQRDHLLQELSQLQDLRDEKSKELEETKKKLADRPASFAVVPYDGPNQTRRRPIYIECREEEIILQPEGIRFTTDDFEGQITADNPLASAVRAATEEIIEQAYNNPGQAARPYPLILVRPEGVAAYHAVRVALRDWESEFGYELVGSDWDLAYPSPDPQVAEAARVAVEVARERQRALARIAPRLVQGPNANRGGSGSGPYSSSLPEVNVDSSAAGRGQLRGPNGEATEGEQEPSPFSMFAEGSNNPQNGTSGNGTNRPSSGTGQVNSSGERSAYPQSSESFTGPRYAGQSQTGQPNSTNPPNSPMGQRYEQSGEYGQPGTKSSENNLTGSRYASSSQSSSSQSGTPGQGQRGSQGGPNAQGQPGTPGQPGNAAGSGMGTPGDRPQNWALRDAPKNSFAVHREIRVRVEPGRFVLIPDQPNESARVIPWKENTAQSADELVKEIWEKVDSWGVASKGFYWQPSLVMMVTPEAERRYPEVTPWIKTSGFRHRTEQTPSLQPQAAPVARGLESNEDEPPLPPPPPGFFRR
ncbi:Hypothetical protein PBC10988_5360 [Planctomycetales bacterium 10988]|nr:Hypothetical protein PBC10988_5360 [Planctomycetales bacterium 10988]